MTAQELINGALRLIGAYDPGETPSSSESTHALEALNTILGSWNAEALPIYQITKESIALSGAASYTLSQRPVKIKSAAVVATTTVNAPVELVDAAGWSAFIDKNASAPHAKVGYYEDGYPLGRLHLAPKPASGGTLEIHSLKSNREAVMEVRETLALTGAASYTIGIGGSLVTERPLAIKGLSVSAVTTVSKGLSVVTAEDWAAYPDKGSTTNFADVLYHDGGYPTSTVHVAPKPASGTLELYTYMPLGTIASLATAINLPHGYERALKMALAADLAVEFGRADMLAVVGPQAAEAKLSISGLNAALLGPVVPPPPPAA